MLVALSQNSLDQLFLTYLLSNALIVIINLLILVMTDTFSVRDIIINDLRGNPWTELLTNSTNPDGVSQSVTGFAP